ncbi:hypothetical protein K435DRAFT_858536 [Dendrothele bispora CBS 962.96]|uniref:Uncharacterized protein n=1 Tax=Dendrothele bispora (strain CBS 962.96) TaxID=1314807 RepID=A0A4S8M2S1_DENBC|nr:hypothetical protein K435DRAFT_858536 [Dendrothele bispora CBS 962.96]
MMDPLRLKFSATIYDLSENAARSNGELMRIRNGHGCSLVLVPNEDDQSTFMQAVESIEQIQLDPSAEKMFHSIRYPKPNILVEISAHSTTSLTYIFPFYDHSDLTRRTVVDGANVNCEVVGVPQIDDISPVNSLFAVKIEVLSNGEPFHRKGKSFPYDWWFRTRWV